MKRHATHLLGPHLPRARRTDSPPLRPPPPVRGRSEALKVLVVESHAPSADTLVHRLRRHGYLAGSVATGAEALRSYRSADMLLLDLDLPDLDGLEVCRSIRAAGETPLIAVTARGSELDRVLGLQAGADDYLVKPYGFRELMARIEAVMRRVRRRRPQQGVLSRGPLRLDPESCAASLDGVPVEVTCKEFDLLHLLASHPGSVVSRRQLMAQVWDDPRSRPGRTLDTHVSSLRGKLGSSGWIITVRGVGFRLGDPRDPR
ncbi:response regulator transcription factor [Streptomyces sp. MUM 203J]|uniref:response regulator transcription factor n=1 Tax=Streptomyces sp. MUM 203J TaxID=2791990 RepID=UPI001F04975C|nr:response regulator transcription factor [Streptomyces sp. MUM 203J]MCH0541789.1 response regulator transcription factor [Streptomyces sp. MUM 203J]